MLGTAREKRQGVGKVIAANSSTPALFSEEQRRQLFPIVREKTFLAHAAVTALPQPVADAATNYLQQSASDPQELGETLRDIKRARKTCGDFIEAGADEIALLGPTSLGL